MLHKSTPIPVVHFAPESLYTLPGIITRVVCQLSLARCIGTGEQEVTAKLERLFSSVKGIKGVSSVSSKGSGRINLSFKKTVNLDAACFEVASLIRRAYNDLPEQVSSP